MERVDVVVVGQGVCALAAVARAAREGVRAIFVDRGPRLSESQALTRMSAHERAALELEASERTFTLDDAEVDHLVLTSALGIHLEKRARAAGAELRQAVDRSSSVRLDPDGWRVSLSGGEPIRAPLLVLAEGARAPSLRELGIATAQRMCGDGADVLTTAVATWTLPPSELAKHEAPRLVRTTGLGTIELWPGRDRVTVRVGPIWSSGPTWPATDHPRILASVARAARTLGLPHRATAIELDETRLDALPFPPTFDGGLVVGRSAGHVPAAAARRTLPLFRMGEAAGRAAATAVLRSSRSARDLGEALGDDYRALFDAVVAELPPPQRPQPVFASFAR